MLTNIKPNESLEEATEEKVIEVGYGYMDQQMVYIKVDDPYCLAKHILTKNKFMNSDKYYVLINKQQILYDPFSAFLLNSQTLGRNHSGGMPYWTFHKTTKDGFDHYVKFLQTKNRIHYDMATKITLNIM